MIIIAENGMKKKINNTKMKKILQKTLKFLWVIKKIDFSYYYRFQKIGKYSIKYYTNSNLTNMSYLFKGCGKLISVNLSNLNGRNITNISSMFYGCESLINVNLSNFNTENITNISFLFCFC